VEPEVEVAGYPLLLEPLQEVLEVEVEFIWNTFSKIFPRIFHLCEGEIVHF
jgi:hypothetical protein